MAQSVDIPAWIILYVGIYALGAGTGEWRRPGSWAVMLDEFERNPALRFVTGLLVLALGAAVYLASPWRPDDWLSLIVTILGGIMTLEGALILAMGDRFFSFASALVDRSSRPFSAIAMLLGIALVGIALIRLANF